MKKKIVTEDKLTRLVKCIDDLEEHSVILSDTAVVIPKSRWNTLICCAQGY